ncbi:hypothetical protein L7F22_006545 [Adiantum nelumboides]|nr:hypothetical protein [Adiantum nelumboides]
MAHCSSTYVHTPLSFASHENSHYENPHDLLPPRKRLLVGLKQHLLASMMPSPPAEPLQVEVHVGATHTSPAPPFGLLLHSHTKKCVSCGDGGVLLHRVPCLAGSSSYQCSSCVLTINKTMYCVLCYQVIEGSLSLSSPLSGLLTCCRCQRLTHLDCALKLWLPYVDGTGLTLCRDCYTRNNGQVREALVKHQKIGSVRRQLKEAIVSGDKVKLPLIDTQELVAAQIVAVTAKKAALEAKQNADILAKAAARAAMHTKAALDDMYKLSQTEMNVRGNCDVAMSTALKDGIVAATKTPKSLKRRALSAIVASELLSKRDGTTGNHLASIDYPEGKRRQISLDSEFVKATHNIGVEKPSCCATQRSRLAVKQRKTLTALGLQDSTKISKARVLKSAKLASRRAKRYSLLRKGKLGAIVSQVLASNKIRKSTVKAPSSKMRVLGLYCMALDGAVGNEVQKDAQSMDALTLETVHSLDGCLPILRRSFAGTDALKPSHHCVEGKNGWRGKAAVGMVVLHDNIGAAPHATCHKMSTLMVVVASCESVAAVSTLQRHGQDENWASCRMQRVEENAMKGLIYVVDFQFSQT